MRRPLLALATLACVFPATAGAQLPPLGQPSCVDGATSVQSASALEAEVAAGRDACVTAPIGDVQLRSRTSPSTRHIGTSPEGSIGHVQISNSSHLTFRARVRSFSISRSNHITIEQSVIGGTREHRIFDQLIFVPNKSDDLTIRDNEIGWTTADYSGNTGYGIRAHRDHDRLRIERNYIHHIGGDGIQIGLDGDDMVIDRNEIAYVAPPRTSDEHSDDIQITGNGPRARVTNNYLHHNGWRDENSPWGGSGPYIHAGTSNGSLLFENNLIIDERNFMQVGGLGTGGTTRSNLTFRRNTIARLGTMWRSSADLEWDIQDGSNNVLERNAIGRLAVMDGTPTHTLIRDNVTGGGVVLDADGNCTSAACNPAGEEPIGYRVPTGVHWADSGDPEPTPPAPPAAPIASYTHSPTFPLVGQPVTFDGSSSTCQTPCAYRWEDDGPDGPGGYQWPLGTGAVLQFTFRGAGYKHVRLIVRDEQGRSASVVKTIAVR